MTCDAFRRADRCFALARSTTFPAERETAIAHGTTIAEAAGIDLDRFDIPGRAQAAPKHHQMGFRSQPAPDDYNVDEIGDLMRAHRRHMEEASA
ncbi:hypothetical protein [Sphingomonas sp. Leaf257]|jgi:hypothetical protein|uniref:hypothetical protein n=1 Tax=Sphingomonas sp. Leaf257 TaxID=1736309 RepID=UPI0006FFC436|nr:hypothetical protein [Sphingomonas sp. Leaf257]KQO51379.1 hypothetical protein ASF14_07720 [Sphingomonas sp. Leaf257]